MKLARISRNIIIFKTRTTSSNALLQGSDLLAALPAAVAAAIERNQHQTVSVCPL